MPHTRTLSALALAASLSLLLASCGGGTPTTQPTPDADDTATVAPVQGGTIPVPADATAAGEFVITGVRAKALAQSLGMDTSARIQTASAASTGLGALAVTDEMRMLLTISRSKSGDNIGKKRATVKFVWGNGDEKIVTVKDADTGIQLYVFPNGQSAGAPVYSGALNMAVKYPDFQASSTKSSSYVTDTGRLCASLNFQFKTEQATPGGTYTPLIFNSASTPLQVCEGAAEEAAEKLALEGATRNLDYTVGAVIPAPWNYLKLGTGASEPTSAELNALTGAPAGTAVDGATFDNFFAPLIVLPTGDPLTWTPAQKAAAATAKKYIAFKKQFEIYYQYKTVKTVHTSALRDDIYVIGQNGFGYAAMHTIVIKPTAGGGGGTGGGTGSTPLVPSSLNFYTTDNYQTLKVQVAVTGAAAVSFSIAQAVACGAPNNTPPTESAVMTEQSSGVWAGQGTYTPGQNTQVTVRADSANPTTYGPSTKACITTTAP